MKRGAPLSRRTPLRAKRWGVSKKVSKAEARDGKGRRCPTADDRRQGKRASAQSRGASTGARSASGASLAFPKPERKTGTKHGRRPREFGRMLFYSTLRGDVVEALRSLSLETGKTAYFIAAEKAGPGVGRVQVMHLHLGHMAGRRRAPDHQTAPGHENHHKGIDGDIGGKARWYVELGWDRQQAMHAKLIDRARAKWNALTDRERQGWDELAELQRRTGRLAVRAA